MPRRELFTRALYLLLTLASIATGFWLLVDPVGANAALQVQAGIAGEDVAQAQLLRKFGAAWLCVSLAFLWCLRVPEVRSRVQPALVLLFGLIAAIEMSGLAAAGVAPGEWLAKAPLALVPPVVLALMLLPVPQWPATMASGPGQETGTVKWFDARKGFGFITRGNGEELFVHYRSIQASGGAQRALRDGQAVRFRVGSGKKGPQAEDVMVLGKKG